MSIELFKRLAFRLMRSSLALVLVLGILVACIQVYLDFRDQRQSIETNVQEIFRVTHNAAGRAVHLLDNRLASEVVKGMQHYNFLLRAAIYDDGNRLMARIDTDTPPSNTLWLTRLVSETTSLHSQKLIYSDGTYEGKIELLVNIDAALQPFYNRATAIFVSGFLRNVSLALILMFLYHLILTRPLVLIAQRFAAIHPSRTRGQRIEHIGGHQQDELGYIVNAANDFIAELESRQVELEQSGEQLRIILDSSPNYIFALGRDGEIIFLNAATTRFYDRSAQALMEQNFYHIHRAISESEAQWMLEKIQGVERTLHKDLNNEKSLTDANDQSFVMDLAFVPFDFFDKPCVLVIASDITDRVHAEERVENLAFFDTLTGLPNRNMLYDHLKMDISRSQRNGTYGALFFIDLDDFKRINDTMGHSVGDDVLLLLSKVMQKQIRLTDTLARLGGDEFTLSLPDLSGDLDTARQQAAEFAERLLGKISQSITVDDNEYTVSASIGVVIYPDCADNTEALLRFADTAMYQAKKAGRNCYRLFEDSMAAEVDEAVRLEAELHTAIKEEHFTFHLQPIIDGHSGKLISAEALMRWQHPERGLVPPFHFIEFLENSGLIHKVDQQILHRVCRYLRRHLEEDTLPEGFRIAINVSAKELHRSDFVQQVEETLNQHQVPGTCIEIEITEGAALQRLDEVVKKITALQRLGITFALDDFGTGYSSLSYLKRLPVNKIKIDQSFIKDLTVDPMDEALVASIIAIAKNLNLKVVAEGVETEAQAAWLNQYDDVWYQGYLYNKPLPTDIFDTTYMCLTEETGHK